MSSPRIVERKGRRVLVTGCCPLAHGKIEDGKLRMLSPHEKRKPHPVEFTPEELRQIADEIEAGGRSLCGSLEAAITPIGIKV